MTQTSFVKPLGEVLLQTGLVSAEQVATALEEQTHDSTLRIGEILARRGWLKQETANFFAERWPRYVSQRRKQPIGQYLRDASLLNLKQVKLILQEQTETGSRFGELIVNKGWLSQETIDFFLHSMDDESEDADDVTPSSEASQKLQNLGEQLLRNQTCNPYQLLLMYQKALWHPLTYAPESPEQAELLRLGLLVKQEPQLLSVNPDYQTFFNTNWVDQELGNLRPFEKVRVNLFKLNERASLPFIALEEVFFWTGREPFLTQALCHAIYDFEDFIPANAETERVAHIVQNHVIKDWHRNVAAKHFQRILTQIRDANVDTVALLTQYRHILRQEENSSANHDQSQQILKEIGLVQDTQNQLRVSNRIYAAVFDEQWVAEELAQQQNFETQPSGELIVEPSREVVLLPPSPQKATSTAKVSLWSRIGKVLLGLLLLGVVGTLLAIFTQRFIRNQTATRSFDQANELLNQGKHEDAIAQYNEVLNLDGNYHQAWTNRGYAFAGTGNYAQMLSSCRSATIIDPQAVYAWNCQGEALHNLKQFDEAIAAFDQAVALDPSDPVFWINKSESLLALPQYESALSASQTAIDALEAITASPSSTPSSVNNELSIAWGTKGRVLQNMERYAEALDAYQQSLTYNSEYFPAQLGKGITLKNLEQYDDANDQFQRALQLDLTESQQAEVWFYSGLTHCKLQQPEDAQVAYDNALSLKPEFEAAETARWNNCS